MARRLIQRALDSALDAIPACHDNRFVGGMCFCGRPYTCVPPWPLIGAAWYLHLALKRLLFAGVQLQGERSARTAVGR